MKKSLFFFVAVLVLAPLFAMAQSYVPIAPIPGLTDTGTVGQGTGSLTTFFNNLYIFLIGLAAALAVVEIIIGGVQYATTDNISHKSDGKARIQQAVLGLILVLMPVIVFSIINPRILNLSLSWDSIQPATVRTDFWGNTTGGSNGTSTGTGTLPTVSGCTVAGSLLQKASCGTNADRDTWHNSCNQNNGRAVLISSAQCSYNPQGQCTNPTPAQAACQTFSFQQLTFVDKNSGDGGLWGSLSQQLYDYDLWAIESDRTEVNTFVNTCRNEGGYACFSEQARYVPTNAGKCVSGSYSFNTRYPNPECVRGYLFCAYSLSSCSSRFDLSTY